MHTCLATITVTYSFSCSSCHGDDIRDSLASLLKNQSLLLIARDVADRAEVTMSHLSENATFIGGVSSVAIEHVVRFDSDDPINTLEFAETMRALQFKEGWTLRPIVDSHYLFIRTKQIRVTYEFGE